MFAKMLEKRSAAAAKKKAADKDDQASRKICKPTLKTDYCESFGSAATPNRRQALRSLPSCH
eukprot:5696939-Amphidinium_carterae.1